jgi:hypothetical protein
MEKLTYIPPLVQVIEVAVEKGFAASSNVSSNAASYDEIDCDISWDY